MKEFFGKGGMCDLDFLNVCTLWAFAILKDNEMGFEFPRDGYFKGSTKTVQEFYGLPYNNNK